jgi:hypothetical protein
MQKPLRSAKNTCKNVYMKLANNFPSQIEVSSIKFAAKAGKTILENRQKNCSNQANNASKSCKNRMQKV